MGNRWTKLQKIAMAHTITAVTRVLMLVGILKASLENVEAAVVVMAIGEAKLLMIHQPVD